MIAFYILALLWFIVARASRQHGVVTCVARQHEHGLSSLAGSVDRPSWCCYQELIRALLCCQLAAALCYRYRYFGGWTFTHGSTLL